MKYNELILIKSQNPNINGKYFKKSFKFIRSLFQFYFSLNEEKNKEISNNSLSTKLNVLKHFYSNNFINNSILKDFFCILDFDFLTITSFILILIKNYTKNYIKNLVKFNLISEIEDLFRLISKSQNLFDNLIKDSEFLNIFVDSFLKFSKNFFSSVKIFNINYDYENDNQYFYSILSCIKAKFSCFLIGVIDKINLNHVGLINEINPHFLFYHNNQQKIKSNKNKNYNKNYKGFNYLKELIFHNLIFDNKSRMILNSEITQKSKQIKIEKDKNIMQCIYEFINIVNNIDLNFFISQILKIKYFLDNNISLNIYIREDNEIFDLKEIDILYSFNKINEYLEKILKKFYKKKNDLMINIDFIDENIFTFNQISENNSNIINYGKNYFNLMFKNFNLTKNNLDKNTFCNVKEFKFYIKQLLKLKIINSEYSTFYEGLKLIIMKNISTIFNNNINRDENKITPLDISNLLKILFDFENNYFFMERKNLNKLNPNIQIFLKFLDNKKIKIKLFKLFIVEILNSFIYIDENDSNQNCLFNYKKIIKNLKDSNLLLIKFLK